MVGMSNASRDLARGSGWTSSITMAKTPGFLDRDGVGHEPFAPSVRLALDLVAALLLHRLRQHADVAHDGDARLAHRFDFAALRDAALQLHRLARRPR